MTTISVERKTRMIIKLLPTIVVLIQTVHMNPGFDLFGGILNTTSVIADGTSANSMELLNITSEFGVGMAKGFVRSAQRIAESLKGLIENFADFKTIFKKRYSSKGEEKQREGIFKDNLAYISKHNELYKKGEESFALGINSHSDLTDDEFRKTLGFDMSKAPDVFNNVSTKNRSRKTREANECKFPLEKDWRKDGAVTPVQDQLLCGSCWAFATTGVFESRYFLKYGKLLKFSEQQLVDCADGIDGRGCHGAYMYAAYEYVMRNGIVTNETYPYKAKEMCAENKCKKLGSKMKIRNFVPIDQNEAALKDAVCRFGPVPIVIHVSPFERFRSYHGLDLYRVSESECSKDPSVGNHAMLLVGYSVDKETKEPYWIVKNSYGTDWGIDGYVHIPRDGSNFCGIATMASYPVF